MITVAGVGRNLWISAAFALAAACAAQAADRAAAATDGERIYREGILPSNLPLRGHRQGANDATGTVAACVNCHRRSGLGSAEGSASVPPITAKYLYNRAGADSTGRPNSQPPVAMDAVRTAYDDLTLAAAIRDGVGRGGHELKYVMPKYELDDAAMSALIAYLKSMPVTASPGVSDTTVDLATIVTPDAEPAARDGMLAVLQQFVADKNAFIRGGIRPMRTNDQLRYRVTRRWQLHVWTLHGAPAEWEAQLRKLLAAEPVFAVLSGIGGADWSPVHRFCEAARLPCILPNTVLPEDVDKDFYSVYFNRGVLLEADLIAVRIAADGGAGRVVQVYDAGVGAAAAARLRSQLPADAQFSMRPVPRGDPTALLAALSDVHLGDSLVLWLDARSVESLAPVQPAAHAVYVSGLLAGLERAPLPAAWRGVADLTYPADLPRNRAVRMNYPLRWFQIRNVAVTAEKVQADTYLACGILSEALDDMLDSFMRDFLVERIESMLGHRQLTGYYPRLGLAPGQRFASKGGYLVRLDAAGPTVSALTDWLVP